MPQDSTVLFTRRRARTANLPQPEFGNGGERNFSQLQNDAMVPLVTVHGYLRGSVAVQNEIGENSAARSSGQALPCSRRIQEMPENRVPVMVSPNFLHIHFLFHSYLERWMLLGPCCVSLDQVQWIFNEVSYNNIAWSFYKTSKSLGVTAKASSKASAGTTDMIRQSIESVEIIKRNSPGLQP